ncbi:MAG: hypothetical protein Ct9H300mP3_05850 [Gammaproteobacteria bacterium]|nr:MAG: hypothetical protein Ct9H300mP3_05850 [Gammaproteobacteria bacterium]
MKGWVTKIKKNSLLALDTETTGLDYMDAKLVGISLSVKSRGGSLYTTRPPRRRAVRCKCCSKKTKAFLESKKKRLLDKTSSSIEISLPDMELI